jgi:hypothetical protein
MFHSRLAAVCLSMLFAICPVKAGVLENAHITGGIVIANDNINIHDFGFFEHEVTVIEVSGFPAESGGTFGAFSEPSPGLRMTVGMAAAPSLFGHAGGLLNYEMEVVGPPGPVPVFALASASVLTIPEGDLVTPLMFVKAAWSIEDKTEGLVQIFSDGLEFGSVTNEITDSFNHVNLLTLTANHVYRITLIADAAISSSDRPSFALAMIDPVFSFAPGTDPAYSFLFSDGIGNSAAADVPEPTSLCLVGAALLAVGLTAGRRWSGRSRCARMERVQFISQ